MNIKMLIRQMKGRPQMFVGEIGEFSLLLLSRYISGFLDSNRAADRAEVVDSMFKYEFHNWVRNKLKKSRCVEFDIERDYVYYLSEVFEDPKERLDVFFEFCEEFFEEVEKGNVKSRF